MELDPGVPCAGTFSVSNDLMAPRFTGSYLQFKNMSEGGVTRYLHLERDRRGGPFSIAGLAPGRYEVRFSWGSDGSAPIEFILPPEGSGNLVFDFARP